MHRRYNPEGPSTQYLKFLVPKTILVMVFGTRVLKMLGTWTLWVSVHAWPVSAQPRASFANPGPRNSPPPRRAGGMLKLPCTPASHRRLAPQCGCSSCRQDCGILLPEFLGSLDKCKQWLRALRNLDGLLGAALRSQTNAGRDGQFDGTETCEPMLRHPG